MEEEETCSGMAPLVVVVTEVVEICSGRQVSLVAGTPEAWEVTWEGNVGA